MAEAGLRRHHAIAVQRGAWANPAIAAMVAPPVTRVLHAGRPATGSTRGGAGSSPARGATCPSGTHRPARPGRFGAHDGRAPDQPGLDHHRRHRRAELRRVRRRRRDHRDHRGEPAQRARRRDAAPGARSRVGKSFTDALPDAVARLAAARPTAATPPAEQVVVLYRITAPGEPTAYGLWAMVDTDQISTSADEPGPGDPQRGRLPRQGARAGGAGRGAGTLLSPVLLLQTGRGDELHAALAAATDAAGAPAATDIDQTGRTHAIWVVPPGRAAGRAHRARRRRRAGRRRRQPPQPRRPDRRPAALPRRGDHTGVGRHPALQPPGQRAARVDDLWPGCARPARGRGAPAARGRAGQGHDRAVRRGPLLRGRAAPSTAADRGGQPRPRAGRADPAARRAGARSGRQADLVRRRRLPGRRGCAARSTPAGPSWPC